MEKYIRYKGKGEHSVNELEKIIEQREEELHLLRSGQVVLPQADVIKNEVAVCDNPTHDGEVKWVGKCSKCNSEMML